MKILATDGYTDWLDSLKDLSARARIQARVERLRMGNPGRHRMLAAGVAELKIDHGPGYRVYYARRGPAQLVLLCGGDKRTQARDIQTAIKLAKEL
jgi:putative addiction module killer protein